MKHVLKSADPVLSISKKIWGNFKLNVKPKFIKCGIWYSQQIVIFFVEVLNLYPKIAKTLLYINLSQFYYLIANIFFSVKVEVGGGRVEGLPRCGSNTRSLPWISLNSWSPWSRTDILFSNLQLQVSKTISLNSIILILNQSKIFL